MLRHLWTTAIGKGCSDVSICFDTKTLGVADTAGRFVLTNIGNGKILFDLDLGMPAWGVAHKQMLDGKWRSAIACGNKSDDAGKLVILEDDAVLDSILLPAPGWDVALDPTSNEVVASCWDGSLYRWSPDSPTRLVQTQLSKSRVFGLVYAPSGRLLANADRNGVFDVDFANNTTSVLIPCNTNAFNLAVSEDGSRIAVGGYGPFCVVRDVRSKSETRYRIRDCYACELVADTLWTGEKGGQIALWSERSPKEPIWTFNAGADVRALVHDARLNALFTALGDGRISRYELMTDYRGLRGVISDTVALRAGGSISSVEILTERPVVDPLVPAIIAAMDAADPDDALNGARTVEAALATPDGIPQTDAHALISAAALLALGRYKEAGARLQSLESGSPWYASSIAMLINCLWLGGEEDAAQRVYAANTGVPGLGRALEDERLAHSSFHMLRAPTAKVDRRVAGIVGTDLMQRTAFTPAGSQKSDLASGAIPYDLVNFIKYEYPSDADRAKKTLEHAQVQAILSRRLGGKRPNQRSLDVGCATCRYPLWFASEGFFATGYDINPAAIEICRKRSEDNPNIRIEQRDVLKEDPETKSYDIITCMMGTFNHFDVVQQKRFFRWCFDSLVPGGMLIFSSWNKDCPFTTFLQFYNRDDREILYRNMRNFNSIRDTLEESDFFVEAVMPAAFLSDECYNAWVSRVDEAVMITIDQQLSSLLKPNDAQLGVFGAVRP